MSLLRELLDIGIVLYALNTLAVPYEYAESLYNAKEELNSTQIQNARGFGEIEFNEFVQKDPLKEKPKKLDDVALQWLKYAHLLTTAMVDYQGNQSGLERGIIQERGNCAAYAGLTYGKFLALADKLKMPEMKNHVRMANGLVFDEEAGLHGSHRWLEVKINREWHPYEPTVLDDGSADEKIPLAPKFVKHVKTKYVVYDEDEYKRYAWLQVKPNGKTAMMIEVIDSLKEPQGYLGWEEELEEYADWRDWKRRMDGEESAPEERRRPAPGERDRKFKDRDLFASKELVMLLKGEGT